MKETCLVCYGSGSVKCEACGGSGAMPGASLLDQDCLRCKGRGRETCAHCQGSGTVEVPEDAEPDAASSVSE
jgi:DnaJ-class molecular chaperone